MQETICGEGYKRPSLRTRCASRPTKRRGPLATLVLPLPTRFFLATANLRRLLDGLCCAGGLHD